MPATRSSVLVGWQLHYMHPIGSKPGEIRTVGLSVPQIKRAMDDLDITLDRFELLEIPLKGFKIFQKRRLPVRTGHRRHQFIRQIRQLV